MPSSPNPKPEKPKLRVRDPNASPPPEKSRRRKRDKPEDRQAKSLNHPTEQFARFLLTLVVVGAPWAYGSVQAISQLVISLILLTVLGIWFVRNFSSNDTGRTNLPSLLLVLFLFVGTLQILPLPEFAQSSVESEQQGLREKLATNLEPNHPETAESIRSTDTISLNPNATREQLSYIALLTVAMFAGMRFFSSRKLALRLLTILFINGCVIAIFGTFQKVATPNSIYGMPLELGGEPFGPFVNRNNAAGFMLLCLGCGLAVVFHSFQIIGNKEDSQTSSGLNKSWLDKYGREIRLLLANLTPIRIVYLVGTGVIMMGIALTLSRGGMIALTSGLIATLLFLFRRKQVRACMVALLFMVPVGLMTVVSTGLQGNVTERLETLKDDELLSRELRPTLWKDSLQAVQDYPLLGTGLGTFRYIYRQYQTFEDRLWFYHAENVYVEILITAGGIGLAILIPLGIYLLVLSWSLPSKRGHPMNLALGGVGFFVLTSQAVSNFFDFGLFIPANGLAFALLMGVVMGASKKLTDSSGRPSKLILLLPRFMKWPVTLLLIGMTASSSWYLYRYCPVDLAVKAVQSKEPQDLSPEEVSQRIELLESAMKGAETSLEAHEYLSTLYWLRFQTEFVEYQIANDPTGRIKDAEDAWQQLTAQTINELPTTDFYQSNIPPSIEHSEKALKICPLSVRSIVQLAEFCYFTGGAPTAYTKAFDLFNVKNAGYLRRMGDFAAAQRLKGPAFRYWRAAMRLQPETYQSIGPTAVRFFDAREVCEKLFPDNPSLLIDVANNIFPGERLSGLRLILFRRVQKILEDRPASDAVVSYLNARTIWDSGVNPDLATEYLKKAIALNPNEKSWKEMLRKWYEALGRTEEAEALKQN